MKGKCSIVGFLTDEEQEVNSDKVITEFFDLAAEEDNIDERERQMINITEATLSHIIMRGLLMIFRQNSQKTDG